MVFPLFAGAAGIGLLCVLSAWMNAPPVVVVRRASSVLVAFLVLTELWVFVRLGEAIRVYDTPSLWHVADAALLLGSAAALTRAWRRSHWEGWVYAQTAFALAAAASSLTALTLRFGLGLEREVRLGVGGYQHLGSIAMLLVACTWAVAQLGRTSRV